MIMIKEYYDCFSKGKINDPEGGYSNLFSRFAVGSPRCPPKLLALSRHVNPKRFLPHQACVLDPERQCQNERYLSSNVIEYDVGIDISG